MATKSQEMPKLPNKELLRVDEVAFYFSISRKTVYVWIEDGKLDGVKVGGTILRITHESVLKCQEKLNL